MSGLKRLVLALWSCAGIFALAALALTVFGPWTDAVSELFASNAFAAAVQACGCVLALGLVVTLLRAIFSRKVRTIEVVAVDGGTISVTKDAIASQAAHIVEADGSCTADRVHVDAGRRGSVYVDVRVLPSQSVDVVEKGTELHAALVSGLAAVCADKLAGVSIEFIQPERIDVPASEAEAAGEPDAAPLSGGTGEITVPMSGAPAHGEVD